MNDYKITIYIDGTLIGSKFGLYANEEDAFEDGFTEAEDIYDAMHLDCGLPGKEQAMAEARADGFEPDPDDPEDDGWYWDYWCDIHCRYINIEIEEY